MIAVFSCIRKLLYQKAKTMSKKKKKRSTATDPDHRKHWFMINFLHINYQIDQIIIFSFELSHWFIAVIGLMRSTPKHKHTYRHFCCFSRFYFCSVAVIIIIAMAPYLVIPIEPTHTVWIFCILKMTENKKYDKLLKWVWLCFHVQSEFCSNTYCKCKKLLKIANDFTHTQTVFTCVDQHSKIIIKAAIHANYLAVNITTKFIASRNARCLVRVRRHFRVAKWNLNLLLW